MFPKTLILAPPTLTEFPPPGLETWLLAKAFPAPTPCSRMCSHFPPHPWRLTLHPRSSQVFPPTPHSNLHEGLLPAPTPIPSSHGPSSPLPAGPAAPTAQPCFPGNNASVSQTTMSFHLRRWPSARWDVAQRVLCAAQRCELQTSLCPWGPLCNTQSGLWGGPRGSACPHPKLTLVPPAVHTHSPCSLPHSLLSPAGLRRLEPGRIRGLRLHSALLPAGGI